MGVSRRDNGTYLVTVKKSAALPGYQKIRRVCRSLEEAQDLEREIVASIMATRKWDDPRKQPKERKPTPSVVVEGRPHGTLYEAAQFALQNHWNGLRSYKPNSYLVNQLVDFMEARGKIHLDDITSEDLDALVKAERDKGNVASHINKKLSIFRIINGVALTRRPPLATVKIDVKNVKSGGHQKKWWMKPEDHTRVVGALRDPLNGDLPTDPLMADLIDIMCYQGLRVEEALRLKPEHVTDLHGANPWLHPDGTKTANAQNSIPIYPAAIPVFQSAIQRCIDNRWSLLFPIRPRQAGDRWNIIRTFLNAEEIPTATLKSLRRTFAWYANSKGMPTATLQKVMRHKNIATTSGYLDLIGSGEVDRSRQYFEADTTPKQTVSTDLTALLQAFRQTGATPEEVARFAKELMT